MLLDRMKKTMGCSLSTNNTPSTTYVPVIKWLKQCSLWWVESCLHLILLWTLIPSISDTGSLSVGVKSESNPGGIRNLAISEKQRWVFKQIKSCYITELLIPHSSPQTWVYRSGESTHYRQRKTGKVKVDVHHLSIQQSVDLETGSLGVHLWFLWGTSTLLEYSYLCLCLLFAAQSHKYLSLSNSAALKPLQALLLIHFSPVWAKLFMLCAIRLAGYIYRSLEYFNQRTVNHASCEALAVYLLIV